MKRERTDSITHLVKIVAMEVYQEMREEENSKRAYLPRGSEPREGWNAGLPWTNKEDVKLCEAFYNFIVEQAENHGRTYGSIRARLKMYQSSDWSGK